MRKHNQPSGSAVEVRNPWRRVFAVGTAALVVPATLALPVVDWSAVSGSAGGEQVAGQAPVTPTIASIALADVDEEGLADSPAADVEVPIIGDPQSDPSDQAPDVPLEESPAIGEDDTNSPARDDEGHGEGHDEGRHTHRDLGIALSPAAVIPQTDTADFGLVGITAAEAFDPNTRVVIRIREDDGWTEWAELPISEHRPDPGTEEAERARYATEPFATAGADGVQVRIDTPDGTVPADTTLKMIDNPVTEADARLGTSSLPIDSASAAAAKPRIISRAQWGANESLRRGTTSYSDTVKVAFVHHVVSSNNYSQDQAAQQMRNVYSWFTQGIGVNDFGYNFVVDRFGNIYEGRAGGIDAAVIGAHTQGFNAQSFAVSFLGNADTLNPGRSEGNRITNAFADLIAWKFAVHHVNPQSTTTLTSSGPGPGQGGTSMYWPGERVSTPTIAGHGDIGSTSCPGTFLRPVVPTLRTKVAQRQGATFFAPSISGSGMTWGTNSSIVVTPQATAASQFTMTVTSACGDLVRTVRQNSAVAGKVSVSWDGKDNAGKRVPPGRYTLSLGGSSQGEDFYPWTADVRVAPGPGSPPDPCSPPSEFTVTGTGYGHGVGLSQWGALGQAREGRTAEQILGHYYPGTRVESVATGGDLRIGLLHQVSFAQVRSEAIASAGGALEIVLGKRVIPGIPGASYNFAPSNKFVQVKVTVNGRQTTVGRAKKVTVRWAGNSDSGTTGSSATLLNVIGPGESFATPKHRYRYGTVEFTNQTTSSGRKLAVVNVLEMNEYLRGIAEVPASWPAAALDAQVIASRSYALAKFNSGVRAACNCHMDDGGGPYFDQTFSAWAVESGPSGAQWVRAVERTSTTANTGSAVTYQGDPIPAFYTAATGGRTSSSAEVWGGAGYPWARGVDDRWSLTVEGNPYRTWSVTASQSRMNQIFGVNDIMTISVSAKMGSDSARTITAKTYDGRTASISATSFRSALGLRSTYITQIAADKVTAEPPANLSVSASLIRRPNGAIKEGSTITLAGRVKPMSSGLVVQRQVRWGSMPWQNRERVAPDSTGKYRFTLPNIGPAGTTYFWRTMVYDGATLVGASPERKGTVRASASASPTPAPTTPAPTTPAPTTPRSDLTVSLIKRPGGKITSGSTVTLRGRISDMRPGLLVTRQVSWDGVGWRSRDVVKPGANGRFRFKVPDVAPAGRTYAWRVVVSNGPKPLAISPERSATVVR